MAVEYLDPAIAGEGQSCNNWNPGAWTNAPIMSEDEYQPDIEPPHINDYSAFKKSKQYGKYFRPYRYSPFPAWLYHPTQEPKLIVAYDITGKVDVARCTEMVRTLGPDWSPTPFKRPMDMTGKSLPVKSDTQRLTEALVAGLTDKKATGGAPVDANAIAAIVAATVAAMNQATAPAVRPVAAVPVVEPDPPNPEQVPEHEPPAPEHDVERTALLELAEKEGIKIDLRWGNKRLKEALGLD